MARDRHPRPAPLVLLALTFFLSLIPLACQEAETPTHIALYEEAPDVGGLYTEGVVGRPRFLNPLLASLPSNSTLPTDSSAADVDICSLVFSGLTRVSGDGQVAPDLASEWTTDEERKSYTFRLRDDALWHDGQPVLAADVTFTFNAIRSPDYPGPDWLARTFRGVTVEKVDDRTVRFTLPSPDPDFPENLSLGLLPAHRLASVPLLSWGTDPFNLSPVGSGPFRVVNATREKVSLAPFDSHSGPAPFLRSLVFRYYSSEEASLAALRAGEVQGLRAASPTTLAGLEGDGSFSLLARADASTVEIMVFNTLSPTFSNSSVRKAIGLGIDRKRVAKSALGGSAVPANSPVSPGSYAYDPTVARPDYSPDEAKRLLDEAGWIVPPGETTRRKDSHKLDLPILVPNNSEATRAAEEIARQLEPLGVNASVQSVGWDGLVADFLAPRRFSAALVSAHTPSVVPNLAEFWGKPSGNPSDSLNFSSWSDDRAESALVRSRTAASLSERQRALSDFQAIFASEMPGVPLYSPIYTHVVSRGVRGVEIGLTLRPADRFLGVEGWYVRTKRVPASY